MQKHGNRFLLLVASEKVFLVKGCGLQPLLWEEQGFRMHIPEDSFLPTETCLISVRAIVTGFFQFLEGTEPVSAVYAISLSWKFYKPIKLELQHCVLLERQEQSKFMSFAVALHEQFSPPYQFLPVDGGDFHSNIFYGLIDLEQLSFISIILWRHLFGKDGCKIAPAQRSFIFELCLVGGEKVPSPVQYHGMTFKERKGNEYIPLASGSCKKSQVHEAGSITD